MILERRGQASWTFLEDDPGPSWTRILDLDEILAHRGASRIVQDRRLLPRIVQD